MQEQEQLMKNNNFLLFLEQFASYLRQKGWYISVELAYSVVWQKQYKDKVNELTLPKIEAGDCEEVLDKTLHKLAKLEGKPLETLKHNIQNQYSDIIFIRVIDESVKNGTIPLADGVKLFEKAQDLIYALAVSSQKAQAYFKKKSGGEKVANFMNDVRLGQTQVGSYIIELSYPVENTVSFNTQQQDEALSYAISFSRGVTHNLVKSTQKLKKAVVEYSNDPRIFAPLISDGVSNNLCQAIAGLSGLTKQREVELSLKTGEIIDNNLPDAPFKINFTPSEIEVVEIAARYYKGDYILPEYEIIGLITGAHSSRLEEGGYITVNQKIQKKSIEIRIDLNPEQYKEAVYAHAEGKEIRCQGKHLQISKNKGKLQTVVHIDVLL